MYPKTGLAKLDAILRWRRCPRFFADLPVNLPDMAYPSHWARAPAPRNHSLMRYHSDSLTPELRPLTSQADPPVRLK